MALTKLYKRTSVGKIQQWQIVVHGNTYFTIEGLKDGKLTESKPTIVEGKNEGKKNATNSREQTQKEAKRKWDVKKEEGYFESVNDIDNEGSYFKPMLAEKYTERKERIVFPVLASIKIDGHRMIAKKDGLFTRNGKKYESCPHIFEMLKLLFKQHPNWIIDGEIYSHEANFEKISSLVRKTKPTAEDLEKSKEVVQYWIFDGVIDDKSAGFEGRFKIITNEIKKWVGDNKSFKFVENIKATSHELIEEYHNGFVAAGFEGLMIRVIDSPYENKRSCNLLKYKHFIDDEYKIVDVEEGIGNRSGMSGSLVLEMKDKKTFHAGIVGGVDYYKELLKNKFNYIGKLATVRYQNLTEDGKPRFPIAVDIGREDIS